MKRRQVIFGALSAASMGTFVALSDVDIPQSVDVPQSVDIPGPHNVRNQTQQQEPEPGAETPESGGPSEESETDQSDDDSLAGTDLDEIDELRIPFEITRADGARDVTALIDDALHYWEVNAEEYAGFDVIYEPAEDGDAYLTIELARDVTVCGLTYDDFSGCADAPESELPSELNATIQAELTERGVFDVAVHEIGHTLGLDHDDEPQYYMQDTQPSPWERKLTNVYIEPVVAAEDILAGLEWLGEHTEAVRTGFQQTTEDSEAGIVVETAPNPCGDGFVSCTEWGHTYPDQLVIRLDEDDDTAAYDWHVAYLVAGTVDERPAVLSEDTPHETRQSDWWAE